MRPSGLCCRPLPERLERQRDPPSQFRQRHPRRPGRICDLGESELQGFLVVLGFSNAVERVHPLNIRTGGAGAQSVSPVAHSRWPLSP